jgi:uncharacterized protein (UPF0335 family)
MLPDINAELTPEQIEQLEQAKRLIPKLKEQLRRAQSAGLDVTTMQADIDALQLQLDKLYRVYVRRVTPSSGTQ